MAIPCRDEASFNRVQQLSNLTPGAHIHLIGICGVGMTGVAAMLKQLGYRITGSDKAFYPPMGDYARSIAEKIYEGFSVENLAERPDMVIIGNSIWRNNDEALKAIELGIPYASMPEVFEAILIGPREYCPTSIVVAGTHGKTTTTAAIATMLDRSGWAPGYFVGGIPHNLPGNMRMVSSDTPLKKRVVVMEGDEYDSCFFAKWPKIHHYRPDIAIMTSLEFDHGDIFTCIDDIANEFRKFVALVPQGGHIIVFDGEPRLRAVIDAARAEGALKAKVWYYGSDRGSDFRIVARRVDNGRQFVAADLRGVACTFDTPIVGPQNAQNCLAAAAAGQLLGLKPSEIAHGLVVYEGVVRRQQIRADIGGILVVEDFAHHPTAIRLTLQGLRETYPDRRIMVAYEPRTNTSKRAFFQQDYVESFRSADIAIIAYLHGAGGYSNTSNEVKALDVPKLIADMETTGTKGLAMDNVNAVREYLVSESRQGDVIVIMSNGDFDNLIPSLITDLEKHSAAA